MSTVETKSLVKRYDNGVIAVNEIDLRIEEGEFLVLLGPSGSGKTSLLRMIAGLEKVSAGAIYIGGKNVTLLPPRARNLSMVFQSYALYPHMSVFRNISFPLKAKGLPYAERKKMVEWAASLFGIEQYLDRKPRQLSGGQRQRVALARALVHEPGVFLLDEPLSNLDAQLRATARDEIKQFQRRIETTTIYVTHDQIEAMGMGDRIAVMNHGNMHQIGTPQQLYREPADTFVATFLGSPPMNLIKQDECIIGFHPEHFLPQEVPDANAACFSFKFHVTRVEYLGADRFIYGTVMSKEGPARVISKIPSLVTLPLEADRSYTFVVRKEDLKYFNSETGKRIEAQSFTIADAPVPVMQEA